MNDIKICTSQETKFTCVPNIFIDRYMHNANGEFVKIYLYLLRALTQANQNISISLIADKLEMTENDVRRSLLYWEKKNLLHLDYNENGVISCIQLISPDENNSSVDSTGPTPVVQNEVKINTTTSQPYIQDNASFETTTETSVANHKVPADTHEINFEKLANFKSTEDGKEIMFISEKYMGHPLSFNEIEKLYVWYDELHFSAELIEYLVEYCVEKGHSSIYYMNKVAFNWVAEGITTLDAAKLSTTIHSQSHYSVMKALGISGRNLIQNEIAFINKWTDSYGFSLDIINEACTRTITAINKPNFQYVDSILSKWHESGVKHLEDIAKLDSQHEKAVATSKANAQKAATKNRASNNRFNNFQQREYSDEFYEDLERRLRAKN
ncbi:MAG: DnaD domain protein [Lachnospiraceae bacterium]|nr:DnaD domain protein [Lachnospiraceae bacterium]